MKNIVLFLTALILGTSGALAITTDADKVSVIISNRYNDSFIFVENGITFSVYPDGEFDFSIDAQIGGQRNGVTFNSGYDYSPFTQYDDYGAVIQVENVPIFYDYYGRVSQIGEVNINYNRNRVNRVGNMRVFYNRRGFYDYHTGYINVYNRNYVFRPFHAFFARPSVGFCLVYNRPYRRFYSPIRYTYYNPYRYNTRRAYAQVGRTHRYNKVRRERSKVYRNDRRVAVRNSTTRSASPRNRNKIVNRSASVRTPRRNTVDKRTVAKRTVAKTSRDRAVTRSTRTDRSPQRSASNRSVRQTSTRNVSQAPSRSRSSAATRSSSSRSVSRVPSRTKRTVATRSTSSRSTASRASSGGHRNTSARAVSSRSARRNK